MSVSTSVTLEHRRYHPRQRSNTSFLYMLLQRAVHFPQLDFDYAMSTVVELCWSPSRVFKVAQSRHEIKGHWSRDDPAFILILCSFIIVDFLAFGLALDEEWSFIRMLRQIFTGLGFFFVLGILLATSTWFLTNKYFLVKHPHSSSQKVEWFYAFDVHCNAYLPAFLILGVLQYLLLPLLVRGGILPALLSNTLFLSASLVYVHITVLGFLHLPFLNRDKVTMLWNPAFLFVFLWFLISLLNLNCTRVFVLKVL